MALREAGQNIRGIIYIDVHSDVRYFVDEFGKAINFSFEENLAFLNPLKRKLLGHDARGELP